MRIAVGHPPRWAKAFLLQVGLLTEPCLGRLGDVGAGLAPAQQGRPARSPYILVMASAGEDMAALWDYTTGESGEQFSAR